MTFSLFGTFLTLNHYPLEMDRYFPRAIFASESAPVDKALCAQRSSTLEVHICTLDELIQWVPTGVSNTSIKYPSERLCFVGP